MDKIRRMYTKLEKINEITTLYKKYQKEIKPSSEKDIPDDDVDEPQTDEDTEEGNDGSANKKPSNKTPRGNENKGKNKTKNPNRDRSKGDDESEEPDESSDDSNQPGSEEDSPGKTLPEDKTRGDKQSDESDMEEDSVKPEKSDTRDKNEKFKKEKNELKTKRINDDEDTYREKRDLIREIISFKRYQSRRYIKRFRDLFKFQIRTNNLFKFIKYCYRFKKIPQNFNQVMDKIRRMYTKLEEINEITILYKKYQKEIKPSSEKDITDDDEDEPQTDEDTQEGNDRSTNKKPSKNTPRSNESNGKNTSKNPKSDNGKGGENDSEEQEDSSKDSRQPQTDDNYQPQTDEEDESQLSYKKPHKGTPKDNESEGKDKSGKQQKGIGQVKEDEGEDEIGRYKFGTDLNDIDKNDMIRGYKNFGSKSEGNMPKEKSRRTSTTGDSKNRGPSPYGSNKENEAQDLINKSVEGRNTPDNSQRKESQALNIQDSEKTYVTKHLFLKYLTFKQYNIKRNTNKFYKLFGFRIRTKLVFKFIKHCYRFKRMPKNHNRVLNKLLSIMKILRPNTLHEYLHFFLKKYDEGVTLNSNEDLRNSAMNAENKSSNRFNGRENNNQNKNNDFYNNKANKGADGKLIFRNGIGDNISSIFKPNKISKNGLNYNRKNMPKDDANQGKDSTKNQDDSDVEHFFGNDEKSKVGNNNRETKANNPQTGSKPNNRIPYYFNGQLGSGYNAYGNINRIINNKNQQQRKPTKTLQNNIQNYDNNNFEAVLPSYDINQQFNSFPYDNKVPLMDSTSTSMNQQPDFNTYINLQGANENSNPRTLGMNDNYNLENQKANNYQMNTMFYNSNQQYDENQSGSQYNMQYDNMNTQMDSTSTSVNQQPSFNTNFNIQGSNENENPIPFGGGVENYISENQKTDKYQTNSMTYNSNEQYDNTQSETQYNMRYDNMNPLTDSMSINMNQQPNFEQSALGYNSQNYNGNDLQTSSMISSMNQEQYNNQYNSFQNGLDSSVQDGSQNNLQDARINSAQTDYALYTNNINQQLSDSQTAASSNTQSSDSFQTIALTDSLPYEQNLLNDMGQTENTDFLNGNQQYNSVYQSDIQQNQPFLEDDFDQQF